MPHPKGWALPPPEHHQEFENLGLDLMRARKKPLTEPDLYGRNGQEQFGIDFVLMLSDGLHGFQSKCVERFSVKDFTDEVAKTAAFPNPLQSYTVLITLPRDRILEDAVTAQCLQRRARGLFPVAIVFWPTLRDWLVEHPEVLKAHYPELAPEVGEIIQARARRLDEEFPGTELEIRARPGHTDVVIHPGPGGIPLKTTFFGQDVFERFQAAMRTGEPVTFRDPEFALVLPDVIAEGIDHQPGTGTLTLTPVLNNRTVPVRVVVHPRTQHHSLAMFERRARRAVDAFPGTLTFLRHGTHRQEALIQADRIAIRWLVEHWAEGDKLRGHARGDRAYAGATVQAALAAENILRLLDGGAYVGIFAEGLTMTWENGPRSPGDDEPDLLPALEMLVELSDRTGWDLVLDEDLDQEALDQAASILHLLRTGRRTLTGAGTVRLNVQSGEGLEGMRKFLKTAVEPLTLRVTQRRSEIFFFGETRDFPPTELRLSRVRLTPEMKESLLSASAPPLELAFEVPEDADVIEALIDPSTDPETGADAEVVNAQEIPSTDPEPGSGG